MSNSEVNTGSNDGDPPKLTVNLPSAKDVDAATKHRNAALLPVDVLLLTVKDCEFFACYRKFINPFRCWFDEIGFLYFEDADNGEKVRVALVQCSEGSVTPGGSLITVTKAVPVLRPKAVISVGTCSSLNPTKTKLGDVVVSAKLKELPTGMRNYVSRRFLKVINHTAYGYKAPLQDPEVREITVHRDGEFLSGPEKVCSESRRKELAQCHHQAIATEMEGGGVFTAAFEDQIEWLIVKGIADYADGDESTTERWSPFASVMAASVVEHILSNAEVFGAWPNYCSEGHSIPSVKFPRADSPSQSTASHSDLSGQQSTCDERKKWTGMNDGKPSGEQSHKKGRKENTSGPTCDLDRLIRLIISAEGLDDEQKEALYEILTHNGQLYVKHRKISGDVLEQGIDFFEYLTETYKFNLVRVIRSSLEITMYCPTIESLEHLWSDYLSGHLNDIAERLLVTDEIKRLLSLQKNVRLRTTIEEENYLICKKFLMEMSGLAGHTLSSSEETIPNQVEDTRKGNYAENEVKELVSPHFLSGLLSLEGFVQILDETPNDVSVIAAQRMMPSLLGLVNKSHEAFCLAESAIHEINDRMDKNLQIVVVEEKNANDSLRQTKESLAKLESKVKVLEEERCELSDQLSKLDLNLKRDKESLRRRRKQLEQAERERKTGTTLGAVLGGVFGGPLGALAGTAIADHVHSTDVSNAEQAVSEASSQVSNTQRRLAAKETELCELTNEQGEQEIYKRWKCQELELLKTRKEDIKESQRRLAKLNESIKNCTLFVHTTAMRAKMMADEAKGELPDIEVMIPPLKAIAGDVAEASLSNSRLLSGRVDMKGIGTKIKRITSQRLKSITSNDVDQWASEQFAEQ